jgi:deoxyribonuclease V
VTDGGGQPGRGYRGRSRGWRQNVGLCRISPEWPTEDTPFSTRYTHPLIGICGHVSAPAGITALQIDLLVPSGYRYCHPRGMETGRPAGHGVSVAVDVHYLSSGATRAAAVVAADAAFSGVLADRTALLAEVTPYRPGEFYLRELPPLRAVLYGIRGLDLLVVDGYADLDPGGRPGLGAHAHAEFGIPVIGVAKSAFRTATHAIPVLRGTSARPLFVTAAGMSRTDAADLVRHMAGRYRLPDALRRADTLARTGRP